MDFLKFVGANKIVIFDGAMGTQLNARGAKPGGTSNIAFPEIVADVHRAYIDAGSNAIITNTFCMNSLYLKSQGSAGDVAAINRAGVVIARKAAGDSAAVIGDIGPTGEMLKPVGVCAEEQMYEAFLEQARALAEAGVDAFIIETMIDYREAACAVRACKENFKLPVIGSMTYATVIKGGGLTTMGHKAADCAAALEKAGADFLGSNCGDLDPKEVAIVVASYRSVSALPILVEPNAGKPRLDENDRAVYDMPPAEFAEGVRECIAAGASLAGGCCGTSPEHIRAVAEMAANL
ncbi:MAG: homocysteine S-methyltransferase family protein [bacterium]